MIGLTQKDFLVLAGGENKMMTRKDYVATAEILNSYGSDMKLEVFEDLVNDFIEMFAEDNERFDSDRFWEECFKTVNHN